jgi:hypothetical protein
VARLQILELPEGSGDDRPPFILVIDEITEDESERIIGSKEAIDGMARKAGARAVAVFHGMTVEIPANDAVPVPQDPEQAAHGSMPRRAIDTGMVDWVLPVQDMPARLLAYFRRENAVALPPEDGSAEAARREDAQSISDLANHEPEPH